MTDPIDLDDTAVQINVDGSVVIHNGPCLLITVRPHRIVLPQYGLDMVDGAWVRRTVSCMALYAADGRLLADGSPWTIVNDGYPVDNR